MTRRPQRTSLEMITEGFEEYYYENVVSPQLEREAELEFDRYETKQWGIKNKLIREFVSNYMKENPQEICGKCHRSCDLFSYMNQCGYVGLEVEIDGFDGKYEIEMKKIPKGTWDETFVPISDKEIKNITAIF